MKCPACHWLGPCTEGKNAIKDMIGTGDKTEIGPQTTSIVNNVTSKITVVT